MCEMGGLMGAAAVGGRARSGEGAARDGTTATTATRLGTRPDGGSEARPEAKASSESEGIPEAGAGSAAVDPRLASRHCARDAGAYRARNHHGSAEAVTWVSWEELCAADAPAARRAYRLAARFGYEYDGRYRCAREAAPCC